MRSATMDPEDCISGIDSDIGRFKGKSIRRQIVRLHVHQQCAKLVGGHAVIANTAGVGDHIAVIAVRHCPFEHGVRLGQWRVEQSRIVTAVLAAGHVMVALITNPANRISDLDIGELRREVIVADMNLNCRGCGDTRHTDNCCSCSTRSQPCHTQASSPLSIPVSPPNGIISRFFFISKHPLSSQQVVISLRKPMRLVPNSLAKFQTGIVPSERQRYRLILNPNNFLPFG